MYYLGFIQELLSHLTVVLGGADKLSLQKLIAMASNNNNTLNTTVSVFAGTNFRAWQQSVGDFLKSQKLWHHATGVTHPVEAVPGAPMAAELQLQGTWDETDDQIKGILGLRLSPNLHTHLGTNSALATAAQSLR